MPDARQAKYEALMFATVLGMAAGGAEQYAVRTAKVLDEAFRDYLVHNVDEAISDTLVAHPLVELSIESAPIVKRQLTTKVSRMTNVNIKAIAFARQIQSNVRATTKRQVARCKLDLEADPSNAEWFESSKGFWAEQERNAMASGSASRDAGLKEEARTREIRKRRVKDKAESGGQGQQELLSKSEDEDVGSRRRRRVKDLHEVDVIASKEANVSVWSKMERPVSVASLPCTCCSLSRCS